MASVTFDQLTKRFGDVIAVNDLNIHIEDREFLVMVGPSGCGKSTALRCLAGLEEISDGQVLIGDQVVNKVPPNERDIAMVFESYALYSHMSVYDNMAFGLELRKTPKDEIKRRIGEAGEALGIDDLFQRRPQELSGGHQGAVAVGRTIVRVPKVFLFDDPLRNLDAKQRIETRANIIRLHQQLETTFIYVTHDQAEAMTMADRIAVLNGGELQQLDAPQSLYDCPANILVAGFIGSPSMNFFPASVRKCEGGVMVDAGSFSLEILGDGQKLYQGCIDKPIVFGIRPEDILNPAYAPPGLPTQHVEAIVDLSEFLGNEIMLHLKSGEHDFIARVDPRTSVRLGESIQVAFNTDRMHIFDQESERAIR